MKSNFKYDVFISHSSKDKVIIRELANKLKEDGIIVWLDEWEIKPGDLIGLKIEKGLEESRTLILAMSENSFASDWVTLERHAALFRDPTNAERRFIPLRLDDVEIKNILRQFAYIDWRNKSDEEYHKMLTICYQRNVNKDNNSDIEEENGRGLKGHASFVMGVSISEDGSKAASVSIDKTIRIWDIENDRFLFDLLGHTARIHAIAMAANGNIVISGSHDKTVRIWDLETKECIKVFNDSKGDIYDVALTPDGSFGVSASSDGMIRIYDIAERQLFKTINVNEELRAIGISNNGEKVMAGSLKGNIFYYDVNSSNIIYALQGHRDSVEGIKIVKEGGKAVSVSRDATIMIWNLVSGKCIATFEGHTGGILSVALNKEGNRIVSGSEDNTVRVWNLNTGQCLAVFLEHTGAVCGVAMNAKGDKMISGSKDNIIRIWELPVSDNEIEQESKTAFYTNAKVLLVGDSGVGKSGLSIRLTEDRFMPTSSTDGVWATQLKLPYLNKDIQNEREIWLWDFAGQSDYRLMHQLFMDETSLAILVFNPQTDNPFEGLYQWTYDLQKAARRKFKKLLVAGRCDRGGVTVSRKSIDDFHSLNDFNGYFETSANTGAGCEELLEAIINTIDWDDIPWTASPRIFQVLKNEILKLKDEGKVLLRLSELKQQLEIRLQHETFTIEELNAVIGLLAGPGLVWKLDFGSFILLEPERINAYAAAVIRKVRSHIEEIGIISEHDILNANLDYQDMDRLHEDEEKIVLCAMHQTFINYNLCLCEPTESGSLLVFPSYFKRERPELEDHPNILITYNFNGNLDDIYSTLIVRLHHTIAFQIEQLWRLAADFKTHTNKKIGIKMKKLKEGLADISIYFEPRISDDIKVTFVKYVHDHLRIKASNIKRYRHYVCPNCDTPVVDHKTVLRKIQNNKKDILCLECEKRILLWDVIEEKFSSEQIQNKVAKLDHLAQLSIDNESKELILVGHTFAIAGEAGQIFRPTFNSDWGIDGEIEFKNSNGQASGKRLYLQLKSGDSYLYKRRKDGKEVFKMKKQRYAEYWVSQAYPVMLVIRTSDNQIRWMNITEYLKRMKEAKEIKKAKEVKKSREAIVAKIAHEKKYGHNIINKTNALDDNDALDENEVLYENEIIFEGEAFNALNLLELKDKILSK